MNNRRASVILVVVGMAALLLTLFLVVTRQLRSEVNDGVLVLREVQARAMLPAALSFILESGRLGQHNDQECFGWTDIRDGGVGPRGPRSASGALPPEVGGGDWPALGSHFRADLFSWQRPPHAVYDNAAPNPIKAPVAWVEEYEQAEDPSTTFLWRLLNPQQGGSNDVGFVRANPGNEPERFWSEGAKPILFDDGHEIHWPKVWAEVLRPMDDLDPGYHHSLATQPVADTLDDFRAGDRTPRLASQDLAWFRIYREKPSDHDGQNGPWFDTMALSGHGVFIITCGAGSTRGFRDWAEVQAAGAGDVFMNDSSFFEQLRAEERILWYRVEWSGFVGGGGDAVWLYGPTDDPNNDNHHGLDDYWTNLATQRRYNVGESRHYTRAHAPQQLLNNLGTIEWIERLPHEPTDGATPGTGRPIW